jgi:nitrite reductase/ring-hydroxylating ferredoxin subunit
MPETCSEFGTPLAENKLVNESIVCPWHASRFALKDNGVSTGPAIHQQPCLQARMRDG